LTKGISTQSIQQFNHPIKGVVYGQDVVRKVIGRTQPQHREPAWTFILQRENVRRNDQHAIFTLGECAAHDFWHLFSDGEYVSDTSVTHFTEIESLGERTV
jgi:hypothetical protein